VCPRVYAETVVVDKPLTLNGDPDAVEAIDCFQPALGELPVDQQAIVDPAGDSFSIAFTLAADDVVVAGFVVQGASVGIDASDLYSGYRIHHNAAGVAAALRSEPTRRRFTIETDEPHVRVAWRATAQRRRTDPHPSEPQGEEI
jgi:hypothetical protein